MWEDRNSKETPQTGCPQVRSTAGVLEAVLIVAHGPPDTGVDDPDDQGHLSASVGVSAAGRAVSSRFVSHLQVM